jgi:hypothetical protein
VRVRLRLRRLLLLLLQADMRPLTWRLQQSSAP